MPVSLPAIAPNGVPPVASLPVLSQLPARRNRTQLSCTHCRHAKLKCDRNSPCAPCIKRGRAAQCTFPPPALRKKPAESMQSRLRHLENLVKDAMNSQASANRDDGMPEYGQRHGTTNDTDVAPEMELEARPQTLGLVQNPSSHTPSNVSRIIDSGSSGQVIHGDKKTTYVGATHWAAILEDVRVTSYFCLGTLYS